MSSLVSLTTTPGLLSACNQRHREVQWNLSNPDTNGAEEIVVVSEVSSFQRLKCMQEWYILGVGKGVLFREVSSVQRCPLYRMYAPSNIFLTHTAYLQGVSELLLLLILPRHEFASPPLRLLLRVR